MKEARKLWHLWLLWPAALLLAISLSGCTGTAGAGEVFDPSAYRMPKNYEPVVYEVVGSYGNDEANGIPIEQYVVFDDYNKSEEIGDWYIQKQIIEDMDMYFALSTAWERADGKKEFHISEKKRLEEYCAEYGFEKCLKIDRACDEDGCRKVSVVCDDDDYDPGIDDYEECSRALVTVDEDIDETMTEIEKNSWR